MIFSKILLPAAAICGSVVAESTVTCAVNLENTIAVGIETELDLLMSVPDQAAYSFADTMKFMDFSEPSGLDGVNPPIQGTLFNTLTNQAPGLDYGGYVGYEENGEFVFYEPGQNKLYYREAGAYDANIDQCLVYNYNAVSGMSDGPSIDSFAYDPRIRGWYIDAKDACSTDDLGIISCSLIWSDFYVFAGTDGYVLGITAAYGITNQAENTLIGVTGLDYTTDFISDVLASSTGSGSNAVAYVMERDGALVGTSNGADVVDGTNRVNAKDSADSIISTSATYLLDNHLRADQTIVVSPYVYTIHSFTQDSLHWYIVVVEDYEEDIAEDCQLQLEQDESAILMTDLDTFLMFPEELGHTVERAFFHGVVPSYASPSAVDLDNGIQDYLFSTSRNYGTIRKGYIGWEDGTFLIYTREDAEISFRPADGSPSTDREYFRGDLDTGRTTSGPFKTSTYDPRTRPWYTEAQAAGHGLYSSIFVFATGGELGITYSVPIYDGVTFIGVVGIDFAVSEIDAILEEFGSSGNGVFLMETAETSSADAYDMIASSCKARVADSSTKTQFKAYDVEDVEDYYISEAAQYMVDNNFLDEGEFEMDDFTAYVSRYDKRSLNWHLVSYEVAYPDNVEDESEGDGSGSSGDDDEIQTVQIFSEAILALLVLAFVAIIIILVAVMRNAGSKPNSADAPLTQGVAMSDVSSSRSKEDV